MPPAVTRPASRKAGASSTPSTSRPETSRWTERSAATSAITWPRRVESLRLTSWIRAPRRPAAATSPRAARSFTSAAAGSARLRLLVSTKQVPAGPANAAP